MKRIQAIAGIFFTIWMLVGCADIATPDELLVQPAISLEKKAMLDAIESFLPDNAIIVTLTQDDRTEMRESLAREDMDSENDRGYVESFSRVDIDSDGSFELIFFCKDKKTKVVNGMILREINGSWSKLQDLVLNADDILRYHIIDLDADGNQEIVIGFYSGDIMDIDRNLKIFSLYDGVMQEVLRTNYDVMDIGDLEDDGVQEIALVTPKKEQFKNEIRLMQFKGRKVTEIDSKWFEEFQQPFAVRIGRLDEKNRAIFVDSYAAEYTGETDIFFVRDKKLKRIQELYPIILEPKAFPVDSEDIDKDGIIEVVQTVPLPSNQAEEIRETGRYAVNYFKLQEDGKKEFVRQMYFSEDFGIIFDVPFDFAGYYDMTFSENLTRMECSYYTKEQKYGLFELVLIHKIEWSDKKDMYQFIDERGEHILAGRVYDRSEYLFGSEKKRYEMMREEVVNLTSVIRPLE